MNLNEKATLLNAKMREKDPTVPSEHDCPIGTLVAEYNADKDIRWMLDVVLWKSYGLYHRFYLEWIAGVGEIIDVIKLEEEIDDRLKSLGVVL